MAMAKRKLFSHTLPHYVCITYEMPIKKLKVIKRATHNKARAVPVRLCVCKEGESSSDQNDI